MVVDFIAQNFNPAVQESIGATLLKAFTSGDFNSFLGVSAFASVSGATGFLAAVSGARPTLATIRLIVGVDQKGTSREALAELLKLAHLGGQAYVFYQSGRAIFHPKFYLFEGATQALLVVGSANLTGGGLFQNTEAGLSVAFDLGNRSDQHWLSTFKTQLDSLYLPIEGPNLVALSEEVIQDLVNRDVVPSEAARRQLYAQAQPQKVVGPASARFPKRPVAAVPASFKRGKSGRQPVSNTQTAAGQTPPDATQELLWEKRNLPASDVQAPQPGKTNPTGGLRLAQAQFKVQGVIIDQTTYFRNVVFAGAAWQPNPADPPKEFATVLFRIEIAGVAMGVYPLVVRHNPTGEAGQGNYTTLLSWGSTLGPILRIANQTGKTLRLFRLVAAPDDAPFLLTIS